MPGDEEVRPFLAEQRHDVLVDLARRRNDVVNQHVVGIVANGMNPQKPKVDGKGGAVDGTPGVIQLGDLGAYVPICGAYPGPKIEHPKGKDTKEGKESKDSKEGKEGKESKDSKEGKDTSDGYKVGGDEVSNPFTRLGDAGDPVPWALFNEIASAYPEALQNAIARGAAPF
jgi:hypothetical protein